MNKFWNITGAVAVLSCGIVKADATPVTAADCANRAQMAYAVAYARDSGKTDHQLSKVVDDTMAPEHRATAKRIIFMVFHNPSLTADNAFAKEKSICKSEVWRNKK